MEKRKLFILFLSGFLLFFGMVLGVSRVGETAQDTVETFGLVENATESTYHTETDTFNDGSVVYVRVDDGGRANGTSDVTIEEEIGDKSITIVVNDDGELPDDVQGDAYYWGKFTLRQGDGSGTDDTNDILELIDKETATITADIKKDGSGTKVITADYSSFSDHANPFLTLSLSTDKFSPDGDGINDTTTISIIVDDSSTPIYGRIEIRDSSDEMVRNLYTPADGILSTGGYDWDGKYDTVLDGGIVPNGTYNVYVIALDNAENSSQQTTTVEVETVYPEISEVNVSPSTISPENGDGVKDSSTITFKAVRTGGGLTFNICDGETPIRDLTSSITVVGDHYSVTWDGKNSSGTLVSDKTYTCKIQANNLSENTTTNTDGTVTVDNTAPSPPTNLTATAIEGGSIKLTWTASSSSDVAQYNIYRATSSGGEDYSSPTYTASSTATAYTDTSTSNGITYYYVVRAQDSVGNIDTNTNEASATAMGEVSGFLSITSNQSIYANGDTIILTIQLSNQQAGCTLTADFSNIDDQYEEGMETSVDEASDSVDNDGDGHTDEDDEAGWYTITYTISSINGRADDSYTIPVTSTDSASNQKSSSITLTLDNTTPIGVITNTYIKYDGENLYDISSSTDADNPTAFVNSGIDEIYIKVNLRSGIEINENSSSITLTRGLGEEAQDVSGTSTISQTEFVFYPDSIFDPSADGHSKDDIYKVYLKMVDTGGEARELNFYFVYDTIAPSSPNLHLSFFNPATGIATIYGETEAYASVEIFINNTSNGKTFADVNGEFNKSDIALVKGENRIKGQSIDRAGNKSDFSKPLKINYNPNKIISILFRTPHVLRSSLSITICYSLTQPAEVNINIFSLDGELIKEYRSYVPSAGEEICWKWYGKNMYNEEVNNGIYILKVTAKVGGKKDSVAKLLGVLR